MAGKKSTNNNGNTTDREQIKQLKGQLDELEGNSKGGKAVCALVFLLILLLSMGAIGICAKLDVGGLASNVLAPIISDVPGIRNILPKDLQQKSLDELIAEDQITQQAQIAADEAAKAEAEAQKMSEEAAIQQSQAAAEEAAKADVEAQSQAEAAAIQQSQEAEKAAQAQADAKAAEQAAADAKAQQEAEQAAASQAAEEAQAAAEEAALADYVDTYSQMQPKDAATIFDSMMQDKSNLVVKILSNMPSDKRAAILSCMDIDNVARITVLMDKALP